MSTVLTSASAVPHESSAVSWGAVVAGAIGACALSIVLLLLGTGLGMAAVSPWANHGISDEAAGVSTILWITLVQLLASAVGGYLAGRLRSRWTTIHTHEVYFRDTAHGFLAWSVATLLMATVLSSAVGAAISLGLSPDDAVASAKATDAARKATALLALWLVVSLLIGAFISAWAATFGGRLRDKAVLTAS